MASDTLISTNRRAARQNSGPPSAATTDAPPSLVFVPSPARLGVSAALVVALLASAYWLHDSGRQSQALSILFGAAFGIVLQRSRFCFFCNFRDWLDDGDPRGLLGIIVALAVGVVGYAVVFGAWLPDPSSGRLPPDAFIGPVSIALIIAGLVFGAGMAVSGSCVSAHLYRLGEGSPTAPFALVGTAVGFALGFLSWNTLYLAFIAGAPVVWLPARLGYAGALIASLVVLAAVGLLVTRRAPHFSRPADDGPWQQILVQRWPAWIGGAIVGVLGMVAYLRVAPLGVTAEIAGRTRQAAQALGVSPTRLEGLESLRGCVTVVRDAILSNNGAFVLALVVAAFACAYAAGQFKPVRPTSGQVIRGMLGGMLLGWGAMIGLGCTVGTLLSGIMAGALSGWVFGAAVFVGVAITLRGGRRAGLLPA